jgi:predicted amino acid-binding ACT domain protein
MAKELIITMTGPNRAGILAAATRAMAELGGDLREASQTVVRGHFTMIFSAEFPETMDVSVIRDHMLDASRPFGIELNLRDPGTAIPIYVAAAAGMRQYKLRLGGRNGSGVLRRLSQVLSLRGIDISGMHAVRTEEGNAFEMVLKLSVPADTPIDAVVQELDEAGREFQVTADLRESSD